MNIASKHTPSVSVIIPLYNKGPYVQRTLASVLGQSFSDIEVLVVDDGSTDDGAEVVEAWRDPRLRLIRQENGGVSVARNRGVGEAEAQFVAFLDADDEWHPDFLRVMWTLKTENPQARFFASSFEVVYDDGQRKWLDFGYRETFVMDLMEFMDCCMRLKSPISSSAVMVSKPLLEQVGMFPTGQKRGEDLDTWVRLLFEVPLIYRNAPLAVYWYGLPSSTCVACQEVYLEGNRVLKSLEEKIRRGVYRGPEKERVLDYLAWYRAGPVERLIESGRCAEARRFIRTSLRSRRLRRRYLRLYLKSFYPEAYRSFSLSVMKMVAIVKSCSLFDE